ncbi:MAG: hypothetical protein SGCHY_002649, partial [Lobulomycetales sp.]
NILDSSDSALSKNSPFSTVVILPLSPQVLLVLIHAEHDNIGPRASLAAAPSPELACSLFDDTNDIVSDFNRFLSSLYSSACSGSTAHNKTLFCILDSATLDIYLAFPKPLFYRLVGTHVCAGDIPSTKETDIQDSPFSTKHTATKDTAIQNIPFPTKHTATKDTAIQNIPFPTKHTAIQEIPSTKDTAIHDIPPPPTKDTTSGDIPSHTEGAATKDIPFANGTLTENAPSLAKDGTRATATENIPSMKEQYQKPDMHHPLLNVGPLRTFLDSAGNSKLRFILSAYGENQKRLARSTDPNPNHGKSCLATCFRFPHTFKSPQTGEESELLESIIVKYGDTVFMFSSPASSQMENEMQEKASASASCSSVAASASASSSAAAASLSASLSASCSSVAASASASASSSAVAATSTSSSSHVSPSKTTIPSAARTDSGFIPELALETHQTQSRRDFAAFVTTTNNTDPGYTNGPIYTNEPIPEKKPPRLVMPVFANADSDGGPRPSKERKRPKLDMPAYASASVGSGSFPAKPLLPAPVSTNAESGRLAGIAQYQKRLVDVPAADSQGERSATANATGFFGVPAVGTPKKALRLCQLKRLADSQSDAGGEQQQSSATATAMHIDNIHLRRDSTS